MTHTKTQPGGFITVRLFQSFFPADSADAGAVSSGLDCFVVLVVI